MAEFALLGEPLALELVNTVVGAGDGSRDLLRCDADAAAWIAAHASGLPADAAERPPGAAALRRLRDAIRSLLDAALDGRAPDRDALELVNAASAAAPPRPQLAWNSDGAPRVIERAGRLPQATLSALARSAVALLGSEDRERLRRCRAPGCVLLFVATNPRRRWCSSATCGNRMRAARHYAKHRPASPRPVT